MKLYFKNIDFLRFFLCIGIILRHLHNGFIHNAEFQNIIGYNNIINNNLGYLPVDCFFIISGFFLFFATDFNQNTYKFISKKFARLLPVIVFATVLSLSITSIITHKLILPLKDVWTLFLLNNVGLTNEYTTLANIWYVSALFWTSLLFFYLYKIMDKKWFNILMACIAFTSYLFYINISIGQSPFLTKYIFNYGLIRSFAGMSLGYFIFRIYKDIIVNNVKNTLFNKIFYTVLEACLLLFVFINMLYKNMDYNNPLIIVLAFAILFLLFISKKGYISKILDNDFSKILGRYTYSIYVTHVLIRNLWMLVIFKYFKDFVLNYPIQNLLAIFVLAFGLGIFTYHVIEKPAMKFFLKK
jgi:peptidoglycan/LPS O-acetylase OafA/YrhL